MDRYVAWAIQFARDVRSADGEIAEIHIDEPQRFTLVFRSGKKVPLDSKLLFKVGYSGTGPRVFHTFLQEAGFPTTLAQIESMKPPIILKR
jgi:hypothetical protein